jgi:hypothetical protein
VIIGLNVNAGWVRGRIGRGSSSIELEIPTVDRACEEAEHAVLVRASRRCAGELNRDERLRPACEAV